jgi:hypothetical protein
MEENTRTDINYFHQAIGIGFDQDVLGLQITMDDMKFM